MFFAPAPLRRAASTLLDALLSPRCVACAEPASLADSLCAECLGGLPPAPALCLATSGEGSISAAVAAFAYAEPVDGLLLRYKFHADLAAGRALGGAALPALAVAARPDALVPVPLHRRRLRERGHDQALLLARDWGRALRLPVRAELLWRCRHTAPQTALDADARRRNVAEAFAVRGRLPAHVALVDDVWTTGSTALAASQALLRAGAVRVDVWTLARVAAPQPSTQPAGVEIR